MHNGLRCLEVEAILKLLFAFALGSWSGCKVSEKLISRYNVTFLKLAIVFSVFLDSIISQLHEDLFLWRNIRVELLVLFAACSDI